MLENIKMGAKVRVSNYTHHLMDIYKDNKFMDILKISMDDIDDDTSETEIKESIEEALTKLDHLRDICIVRNDAIVALEAYSTGLNVNSYESKKLINIAIEEISVCYDVAKILDIRNECMTNLRNLVARDEEIRRKRR